MFIKNSCPKLITLSISLCILFNAGCKKKDNLTDDTKPPLETPIIADDNIKVTATVTGTVLDENNQPVVNAAVTSTTYSTTTDTMGNFVFKNINISAANGFVRVTKAGYFKGTRSFVTEAGKNNYVKIQLIKQVVTGTLTASSGGVINTLTGASILFPPNAFVTASGAAYSGNVIVYATWIDPTASNLPLVVPGDLRGINSSNGEYLLKSYGMVGADFTDNSGNTLKIAPGKTATISFPIPASLQANAPATIPLWHFDDTTARWKENGTAVKNGNVYTAQVSKFSFWNADGAVNFIKLNVRFINNANNLPLSNVLVKVTSLITNTFAYGYTNDSGYVSGYVPKNENLTLEIIPAIPCATSLAVYSQNIGPYSSNTSLGTINVTLSAANTINFTGTITDCNNQPVTNGYLSLSLANGISAVAYANATGAVNFSLVHCGGTQAYNYIAVDLSAGAYTNPSSGTATTSNVNIGTVAACGNVINTSDIYIAGSIDNNAVLWKNGVAVFLTNKPISTGPPANAWAVKTLVSNNDEYVVGNDNNNTISSTINTIKLWKNRLLTNITTGTTWCEAVSFDVYNNDVYICGFERNSSNVTQYKIWKNGVASILPIDTFEFVQTSAIKVVNGDVYVTGSATKKITGTTNYITQAIYWKNGVINVLTAPGVNGEATGITALNGDIYIIGHDVGALGSSSATTYWKNGVRTVLPLTGIYTNTKCYSIFVDNTDVYTAATVRSAPSAAFANAGYWKNNTLNLLTSYSASFYEGILRDIYVKNNIVYAVGNLSSSATGVQRKSPLYFQNGVPVVLGSYTSSQDGVAYSIFVK